MNSGLPGSTALPILLVEDNPLTRKMLRLALESEGFVVREAGDGATARHAAAASPPAVYVLDYVLPDTDGLSLLDDLNADAGGVRRPAFVITGMPMSHRPPVTAGDVTFLAKPVDLDDVVARVRTALTSAAPPAAADAATLRAHITDDPARREALLHQAAEHTHALSIMRGLGELIARPEDVVSVIGEVLIHNLDAAGLSAGLLYVVDEHGRPVLRAHAGLPDRARPAAETFFGSPDALRDLVQLGEPVAFAVDPPPWAGACLAALQARSLLAVPFLVGEETVGVVVLASGSDDLRAAQWMTFARGVAVQFSQAVTLAQSLARVRLLGERFREVVWMMAPGFTRVHYVSVGYRRLFGASLESLHANPLSWLDFVHPDDRAAAATLVDPNLEGDFDLCFRIRREGHDRWVRASGFVITDPDGRPARIATTLEDITERHEAEQAHVRRSAQLQALADAALGISSARTTEAIADRMLAAVTPLSGARAASLEWGDVGDQPHSREMLEILLRGGSSQVLGVLRILPSDPRGLAHDDIALLTQLAQHAGQAVDNRRLLAHLEDARVQLEALSRRIVALQEDERRHIARELHDDVGQLITGLTLMLEARARAHPGFDAAPLHDVLTQIHARVRDLSHSLRPPMLDDLGLIPALTWQCERYHVQTGIRVDFHHRDASRRFDSALETAVFRIVQEALTNVARHARADRVSVEVWATPTTLGLHVQDAGVGFDTSAASPLSSGLANMRQRALLVGGALHISSRPGDGTQVWAELPLASYVPERMSAS